MKADIGVSPSLYLVLEVKSEKKGKDVIDSHSMLLRNFFKGKLHFKTFQKGKQCFLTRNIAIFIARNNCLYSQRCTVR